MQIESLEDRCLLSVSAAASTAELAGSFAGDIHVSHLPVGFLGASEAAKLHTIPANLTLSETANGLLSGTLTIGPNTVTGTIIYNVQGSVRGHSFNAVFWQGSGPVSSATSVGRLTGSTNKNGSILQGSAAQRIGGHNFSGSFRLAPTTAPGGTTATTLSQALAASAPIATPSTLTGVAHVHAKKGFGSGALAAPAITPRQGMAINITTQSAAGLIGGTILVQNLGTFNFVGSDDGASASLFLDGSSGSGHLSARISHDIWVGSLDDNLNGQLLTGTFRAAVGGITTPHAGSGNTSGSGSNVLTGTDAGIGIGGTPVATTSGTGTGTPTTNPNAGVPGVSGTGAGTGTGGGTSSTGGASGIVDSTGGNSSTGGTEGGEITGGSNSGGNFLTVPGV